MSLSLELPSTPTPPPENYELEWDGPHCQSCASPLAPDQLVCKICGYYASLGIHVEIDSQWEQVATGGESVRPKPSLRQSLTRAIPLWGWKLMACNMAIIAAGIALGALLPEEAAGRTFVSVSIFLGGLVVAFLCHTICFVTASLTDTELGMLDMVIKPLKGWISTCSQLPRRLWLVMGASGGVNAALCATLFIGGIPFHMLLDWDFKQPPKQNLVEAIVAQAKQNTREEETDLAAAVQDFAGQPDIAAHSPAKEPQIQDESRVPIACLILGYNLDEKQQISRLLLAAEQQGQLVYCGTVWPRLEPNDERQLRDRFQQFASPQSFVSTSEQANWVEPRFTCRVTAAEVTKTGQLTQIEWDRLLGELNVPR